MAVDRVTIHHEGAGSPDDFPRGAAGGYSAWIGATHYTILRSPYVSYATLDYNHVSFDICLSGDRHTGFPVTDHDVAQIQAVCAYARGQGWLVDHPSNIVPHRWSPGSSTVCPGDRAMARWSDIAPACTASAPPPPPPPPEVLKMFVDMERTPSGNGYYLVKDDGAVFSYGDAHYQGGANGLALAAPICAISVHPSPAPNSGYWLLGQDGGVFAYGAAKFYGHP